MKTWLLLSCYGIAALLCLTAVRKPAVSITPTQDTTFTSTREVTSLAVAKDGTLWVGTSGGVLSRNASGEWRKWTRQDGLPSHETRQISVENGIPTATFPQAKAEWQNGQWSVQKIATLPVSKEEQVTCTTEWHGQKVTATLTELRLHSSTTEQTIPLPPSRGTHVSALLPHDSTLWAALFGDGIWEWNGVAWKRLDLNLPARAREITAMAMYAETLWLGTRREGVWQGNGQTWTQHQPFDEPYNHNVQIMTMFQGQLWVSTLEDGLAVKTANGWKHIGTPELSSVAPRQLVEFGGALWVRHGNGKVDKWDGRTWSRDVCAGLPIKQTLMIATDRSRLYAAQWGGWSEWDGKAWTHHFEKKAELQKCPITFLLPDGETFWIGTQNHGLAEINRCTSESRWHDERHGLPDDWITAMLRVGKTLHVGTFVGGMLRYDGAKWSQAEQRGENITAFAPDGAGGIWAATRTGLWHQDSEGKLTQPAQTSFLDSEVQALCAIPGGVWVGTRTGLFFLGVSRLPHVQQKKGRGESKLLLPPH